MTRRRRVLFGVITGIAAAGSSVHASFPPQALLPATTDPLSLQVHARTWLHVNCGSCHRPGGSSQADLDLRYGQNLTKLANGKPNVCDAPPGFGDGGVSGAKLITPGKPALSVLLQRVDATPGDDWFMPRIGVTKKQQDALKLLQTWIGSLQACP